MADPKDEGDAKALEEATLRRLLQTPPKPHKTDREKANKDRNDKAAQTDADE